MYREGRAARWAGAGAIWRQIQLGEARLRWVEAGTGPPLLFLHGYAGTARWWTRNIAALSDIRHAYALDLPGFGGSSLPGRFTLDRAADVLAAWMAACGLERADLVAHSMGGQLALLLAARHPILVRSLILAAPAGIPFDTGLAGIAWRALHSRQGGDFRFTPIVTAGALVAGPRSLWHAVGQIRTVDVRPMLAAIKAPVLILWGQQDRLLPAQHGPLITGSIPGAQLRIVPGGGHNLMFEQPALFNAAVREFLRAPDRVVAAQTGPAATA